MKTGQGGALMAAPAAAILAGVAVVPVLGAVWLSLHRSIVIFHEQRFVGLGNFEFLLHDARFWSALGTTVYFTAVAVAAELLLGLGVALLLQRGKGLLRAAVLLPLGDPDRRLRPHVGLALQRAVRALAPPCARHRLAGRALHRAAHRHPGRRLEDDALRRAHPARRPAGDPRSRVRGGACRRGDAAAHVHLDHAAAAQAGRARRTALPLARRVPRLRRHLRPHQGGPANATETLSIYAYKTLMRSGDFGYGSTLSVATFACVLVVGLAFLRLLGRER